MAAALNMKDDNPVLLEILNELESDDAWDPSSIIGRVYVKQGVKRFKLGGLEKFMEVTSEEKLKESFSVSSAGLSKEGLLSSSSSSDGLNIKMENPGFRQLQSSVAVLRSAKGSPGIKNQSVQYPDLTHCCLQQHLSMQNNRT